MKFLLAVSVNHQELKGKILYHLVEIGEQFKVVDSVGNDHLGNSLSLIDDLVNYL